MSANTNTELLAARAALKLAEQQIAELRTELDKMKASGATLEAKDIGTKLDRLQNLVAETASVTLRVEFGFSSIDFKPSEELARVLVPAVKSADRINLRGFTTRLSSTKKTSALPLLARLPHVGTSLRKG